MQFQLLSQIFFILGLLSCLLPQTSSAIALVCGMILGVILGNPFSLLTRKWTTPLMQASIIGLGGSMNLITVIQVGAQGFVYTLLGITLTLLIGISLGKLFKTQDAISLLISVGTAICGGSAIAAIAPIIGASATEISMSLATVFFLNSVALFLFPWLGHSLHLTEQQFGMWSALAIHDTSSVVGAALQFGNHALEIATTVKLARALWIVPLAFVIKFFWSRISKKQSSIKKPWFILGFIAMAALVTWIPQLQPLGNQFAQIAKKGMKFSLFLIGCGLTRETLLQVGTKAFTQGLLLWFFAGGISLALVR